MNSFYENKRKSYVTMFIPQLNKLFYEKMMK